MPQEKCPKCASINTYLDDEMMTGCVTMACKMCGKRWPLNGTTPIIVKTLLPEDEDMKTGKCRNCGRTMNIVADDLCGGCYFAVRGLTKGTPEYDKALADAKARFNDPDYKQRGKSFGKRRAKSSIPSPSLEAKQLSTAKIKEVKVHAKALGIKQSGGDPDTAFVIGLMDAQIDEYKSRIEKLTAARKILAA